MAEKRSKPKTRPRSPRKSAATSKAKAAPPAKIDTAAAAAIVEQVRGWIVEGQSEADIVEAIAHHWPKQDAARLIEAVMVKFAESGQASGDVVRGWCLEATQELYRQALRAGELATALRAVRQVMEFASE